MTVRDASGMPRWTSDSSTRFGNLPSRRKNCVRDCATMICLRVSTEKLQKKLLTGDYLTIPTRDQQLDELGWDRREFYSRWNVLSQYTHILPFAFYRMEANGRNTGVENDFDRTYIFVALIQCTAILNEGVDRMIEIFPDVAEVRKGLNSKFSPGPRRNLPKPRKRRS